MKEQTELKKLVEQGLMIINEDLEDKIKEEERVREALKNNTKTRITAMSKMEKDILASAKKAKTSIEMDGRLKLLGCGMCEGFYAFTDGYKIFWLNDNLGYEVKYDYVNTLLHYPEKEEVEGCPTIEEKDLKYLVKLKENYVVTDSLYFDYKQIEQILKVMGSSKIYYMSNKRCLYFKNVDTEESCLLIGVKYTKTQE